MRIPRASSVRYSRWYVLFCFTLKRSKRRRNVKMARESDRWRKTRVCDRYIGFPVPLPFEGQPQHYPTLSKREHKALRCLGIHIHPRKAGHRKGGENIPDMPRFRETMPSTSSHPLETPTHHLTQCLSSFCVTLSPSSLAISPKTKITAVSAIFSCSFVSRRTDIPISPWPLFQLCSTAYRHAKALYTNSGSRTLAAIRLESESWRVVWYFRVFA